MASAVLALAVTGSLWKYRETCMRLATRLFRSERQILFLLCIVSILASLLLDLDLIMSTFLNMLEEVFELNAGLALCFIPFSMFGRGREEG
jgi:hypothetical protein